MVNLLVRLYDPTEGKILIDGEAIDRLDLQFLREKIGFVSQDTILFNQSIHANILHGRPNSDFDTVVEASKAARVDEFVDEMKNGYGTMIGDRGVQLSGGQRQRISIAQVFLKDPEVLVLDEATSALDTLSERFIQQSIDNLSKGRTLILIAHRLSTIKGVDKIIVLERGEIAEYGDWETLVASEGVFYKMIQAQADLGI